MLNHDEKMLLDDLRGSDFYPPLLKAFSLAIEAMQRNLLTYKVDTEEKAFALVQLKSEIDGANKLLALVKTQLEKQDRSNPSVDRK